MSGEYGTTDEGGRCLGWKADAKLRRVQFPDVSQTLFVTTGMVTAGTAPGLVAILTEDNLMLETKTNSPTWIAMETQTNTAEATGRISYEWELLLSRRSRGNRVSNLQEHQLIICSMENQSWASVISSLNKCMWSNQGTDKGQHLHHLSSLILQPSERFLFNH